MFDQKFAVLEVEMAGEPNRPQAPRGASRLPEHSVTRTAARRSSRMHEGNGHFFQLVAVFAVFCLLSFPHPSSSENGKKRILNAAHKAFLQDYAYTWGEEIVQEDGTAVLSIIDKYRKGGGWTSRQPWIHGIFSAKIKIPAGASCGAVTAFYLTSEWNMAWKSDQHDEIDFEILGADNTGEIQIQTNYFVGGKGGHEERLKLWFDPTVDFHEYKLQVNKEAVRWYIDDVLVREITAETPGGLPTTSQFMVASLWNGAWWVPCTVGKKREDRVMDYSKGPFTAYFRNITMIACYWRQQATKERPACADPSKTFVWDYKPEKKDWRVLEHVQKHYIIYDWKTWNLTNPNAIGVKIEAPEERTSQEIFDLAAAEGNVIRAEPMQEDDAEV